MGTESAIQHSSPIGSRYRADATSTFQADDTQITQQQVANVEPANSKPIVWQHASKGVSANIEQAGIGSNQYRINSNGDGVYFGNSLKNPSFNQNMQLTVQHMVNDASLEKMPRFHGLSMQDIKFTVNNTQLSERFEVRSMPFRGTTLLHITDKQFGTPLNDDENETFITQFVKPAFDQLNGAGANNATSAA